MKSLLFAYGTLMPTDPEKGLQQGWRPDAVRGRLYDLGTYPALINLDDPTAGWIDGFVGPVEPTDLDRYDRWEEVDTGLYRRVETTTRNHFRVWIYVYARPIPADARGPLARWQSRE